MNILKPQNLHFQKLENKCLIDLDEDEKINYCNFENEEYNNINLYVHFQYTISGTSLINVTFFSFRHLCVTLYGPAHNTVPGNYLCSGRSSDSSGPLQRLSHTVHTRFQPHIAPVPCTLKECRFRCYA